MRHGKSPKGARKSGELDVRAEKGTEEVQNWENESVDWTLKQWNARRKSKRSEKEW